MEKKDGSTCFCIDYHRLNTITKNDTYPLSRIDDTLDHLHGATIFSSIDLAIEFWHISLADFAKENLLSSTERGYFTSIPCRWGSATPHIHSRDSWTWSWAS